MATIWVLHGPNLNLLGERETSVYGATTLADINQELIHMGRDSGHTVDCFQSNLEGELVNKIQQSQQDADILLFNPAAYTHTSIAIRDALLATQTPFIEVHCSHLHQREDYRTKSLMADLSLGVISGFKANSYRLAMQAALNHLENS